MKKCLKKNTRRTSSYQTGHLLWMSPVIARLKNCIRKKLLKDNFKSCQLTLVETFFLSFLLVKIYRQNRRKLYFYTKTLIPLGGLLFVTRWQWRDGNNLHFICKMFRSVVKSNGWNFLFPLLLGRRTLHNPKPAGVGVQKKTSSPGGKNSLGSIHKIAHRLELVPPQFWARRRLSFVLAPRPASLAYAQVFFVFFRNENFPHFLQSGLDFYFNWPGPEANWNYCHSGP